MIYEILGTGAEQAISGRYICDTLDIPARVLTKRIEQERRAGHPICACYTGPRPGYYLAANREEMERYCRQLLKRAGEIHKTRRACLHTLADLPSNGGAIDGNSQL